MILVKDIYDKEQWINISYLVLTKEEILPITDEYGRKQEPIHCWKMSFVDGSVVYISDEQKKLLTEPDRKDNNYGR